MGFFEKFGSGGTVIAVAAFVATSPVRAETALDLTAAYAAALGRSETLATQLEAVNQAEERANQALGGILPSVGFTASRLWQQEVSGFSGALFPPTQDTVKLTGNQPLFRGLRDIAALRQARRLSGAQAFARQQAELQLYQDVAQALYLVLSLEKESDDVQREISVYEKRIGELRGRMRIGRSRESEVLTVEAALATLRAQLDAMGGQLAGARQMLAFLTGRPADAPVTDREPGTVQPGPVEPLLARIEGRPDVQAAREAREAADLAKGGAWGAHLPNLDLNGNYYFLRPGSLADSHWDVQLLLTLPIFSGGIVQSRYREASSLFTQADLAYTRAQRLAEQQIRALHATCLADSTQLQSLMSAAELNERNFQVQNREYRLGMATNLDVLQALTAVVESKRARDRAVFGFKVDRIRLEGAAALRPGKSGE